MKLLYQNFDGLDITFQGAMPMAVLDILAQAREKAQAEKRPVLAEIGTDKMRVLVAESGGGGGYRYRFDTGMDGEIWFIVHSQKRDQWNIRVSVKSLTLALYGYEGVKQRLLNHFMALGAKGLPRKDAATGAMVETPLECISRFDYCVDFAMDGDFMPLPERFIAHQRCKKHCHGTQEIYNSATGDKINTIRIGEMPGRQATIYNKTKEIVSSAKPYWWDIWGLDKDGFKETIWRIELRAGKHELGQWNLKRFDDFERRAGDVIASIFKAIRYTEPLNDDNNRSRWPMHPIWQDALKASFKALAPHSSQASRGKIITGYRDNVTNRYRDMLIGLLISYTVIQRRDLSEIPIVMDGLYDAIAAIAKEDIASLTKKADRAMEKFRFLEG